MKKAMKQSALVSLMGFGPMLLAGIILSTVFVYLANANVTKAHNKRFDLTANANLFSSASSYLSEELRSYAATGNQSNYQNYWSEVNGEKNRDISVLGQIDTAAEQVSAGANQMAYGAQALATGSGADKY